MVPSEMQNETATLTCLKKHRCFGGWVEYYAHPSSSTQTTMRFSVFRPSRQESEGFPVLFWLSGLTCTEENFMTKSQVQRWAEEAQILIVAPDTSPRGTQLPGEHDSYDFGSGASFYVNATTPGYRDHYRMGDYIARELPALIKQHFPVDEEKWGIFGHSMGGHGALVLGLNNPSLFKSISAFAPICAPTQCEWGQKAFRGYLGDGEEERRLWKSYDATELIRQAPDHSHRPPILVDQGTEDEFLEKQLQTELLVGASRERNWPVNVRYQQGYDHSYYFIATFIKDHLDFHVRQWDGIGRGRELRHN